MQRLHSFLLFKIWKEMDKDNIYIYIINIKTKNLDQS